MYKLITTSIIVVLLVGCSSKSDRQQTKLYSPSSSKVYSHSDITEKQIEDYVSNCFNRNNSRGERCGFGDTFRGTTFNTSRGFTIAKLHKGQKLDGIILKNGNKFPHNTGRFDFFITDKGVLYNVTLKMIAAYRFNPNTGRIVEMYIINSRTADFSKSQDVKNSEPAWNIGKFLFKKGVDFATSSDKKRK